MSESEEMDERELITRREAVMRVSLLLGGVALVGGSALITGCRNTENYGAPFTTDEVALLDEVADTILPPTTTPGAKAAKTGAFMAKMVYDSYHPDDQKIFREGMGKLDDITKRVYNVTFMKASPDQRLAILTLLDREQRSISQAREDAFRKKSLAYLTDQRKEAAPGSDVGAATAATATTPTHYFRMMKELALLGYFTSEIGCTVAQRYAETPGAYNPCAPYTPGEKSWAPHA